MDDNRGSLFGLKEKHAVIKSTDAIHSQIILHSITLMIIVIVVGNIKVLCHPSMYIPVEHQCHAAESEDCAWSCKFQPTGQHLLPCVKK